MRTKNISLVFKKEVMDTLRDRRTLFVMIILPILLYPVMIILLSQLTAMQAKKIRSQKMKLTLKTANIPSELRQAILEHERLTIVDGEWNSFDFLEQNIKTPPSFIIGYQDGQLKTLTLENNKPELKNYIQDDDFGQKEEINSAILLVRKTKNGVLTFDDSGNMHYWEKGLLKQKTSLGGNVQDFLFYPNSQDFLICGNNLSVQRFSWENGLPVETHSLNFPMARLLCLDIGKSPTTKEDLVFVGTQKGQVLILKQEEKTFKIEATIPIEKTEMKEKLDSVGPPKRYKKIYPVRSVRFHENYLCVAYKNQLLGLDLLKGEKEKKRIIAFKHEFKTKISSILKFKSQITVALTSGELFWVSAKPGETLKLKAFELKNHLIDYKVIEDKFYAMTWGLKMYTLHIGKNSLLPLPQQLLFPDPPKDSFKEQLELLRKNDIQLILEIPPAFEKELDVAQDKARLLVHYYGANDQHQTAYRNFEEAIEIFSEKILTDRLLYQLNQDPEFATPIKVYSQNEASPEERGAFVIGKIIAMMIILMTITCPFYPAIDLGAGEKERGTMETLLVSPLDRREIVIGKYLTIVTVSLLAALLNLASMAVTFTYFAKTINSLSSFQQVEQHLPDEEQMDIEWKSKNRKMSFEINAQQIFIIFALLLPLTGLFAAASLALSVFAKSYKEGQYYLTPLIAVSMPLAMAGILPNVELTPVLCTIPVLNVVLLFKELFLGQYITSHILISLGSTVTFCIIAIYWTVGIFSKEEVLFRESDDVNLKFWIPVGPARSTPMRLQSVFLFIIVMILIYFVGQFYLQNPATDFLGRAITEPSQAITKILWGLFLTQVLLIVLPTLWLIKSSKLNFKETLSLKPFKPVAIPLVLILIIACLFINFWISGITHQIFPDSGIDMKRLEKVLNPIVTQTPWIFILLIFAVAPGICEEILFRGFLLSGFRENKKNVQAAILVGICFGLFHLYPAKYFTTGFMGVILAIIVLRTGSIYPAMIAHAFNNSALILFEKVIDPNSELAKSIVKFLSRYGNGEEILPLSYLIPSVIVAGICIKALPSPVDSITSSEDSSTEDKASETIEKNSEENSEEKT